MIGIYLLVTIFSQLTTLSPVAGTSIWNLPSLLTPADQSLEVQVAFDELNGLHVGSPVIVDGKRVGVVANILQSEEGDNTPYQVSLTIAQSAAFSLGSESIALQASPMSVSRLKPETVVELVSLPGEKGIDLKGGEHLSGFSSLEEFWSAPPSRS